MHIKQVACWLIATAIFINGTTVFAKKKKAPETIKKEETKTAFQSSTFNGPAFRSIGPAVLNYNLQY